MLKCGNQLFADALFNYTNGTKTLEGTQATASIFTSYPAPYLSAGSAFGDLVIKQSNYTNTCS